MIFASHFKTKDMLIEISDNEIQDSQDVGYI